MLSLHPVTNAARSSLPNIVAITAAVLFVVFAAMLVMRSRQRQPEKYAYLKQSGQKIEATIVALRKDNHIRLNYESPYMVVSRWNDPATNADHTFISRSFWDRDDPAFQLRDKKTIDVYVEPGNFEHYYVDLSSVGL